MTAIWALGATAALVIGVGVALRHRSGRVREPATQALPAAVLAELADRANGGVTLLQLSTTFCGQCRQAKSLLTELASATPGLRHVEVDVTDRPDITEPLRVRSTPTILAVDAAGRELLRLVGVPRRDELMEALRPHLP